MKHINKIAKIVTRIVEIFHWVGAGIMTAATVFVCINPAWAKYFFSYDAKECCGAELGLYGFTIKAAVSDGVVDRRGLIMFCITAVILLGLMAIIFRNLHLIIKKSEGTTPFQSDNVRMLREVGYFSMAVPVVGFVMSIISRIVIGAEAAEISVGMEGFVIGIVVLCVTQFFAHGTELEKDVEGLL